MVFSFPFRGEAMIDLVIFDCDGVLADSECLSADVLIEELGKVGVSVDHDFVRETCLGRSFASVTEDVFARFDVVLDEAFEAKYRERLLARFETELRPTPGIVELLEGFTLPTCVATSSSPPRVKRTLELTGLARFFGPHVFTASQVERGKPAPDLFLFAAEKMGVSPGRALVVEDSIPGLIAANAAGMPVLAYTGGGHIRGVAAPAVLAESFDNWARFPQLMASIAKVEN